MGTGTSAYFFHLIDIAFLSRPKSATKLSTLSVADLSIVGYAILNIKIIPLANQASEPVPMAFNCGMDCLGKLL